MSDNFKNSLSFEGSLEYWVVSSGEVGNKKKSILRTIEQDIIDDDD